MIATSPATIIRHLLLDQGLGSVAGSWPIFSSFLPEEPNESICVYDTAGKLDGRSMRDGEQYEHRGIQIRVRGPKYGDLWKKVEAIVLAIDAVQGSVVAIESDAAYTVHNISRTGGIHSMGIEIEGDRRRHNLTVNAITTIEKG